MRCKLAVSESALQLSVQCLSTFVLVMRVILYSNGGSALVVGNVNQLDVVIGEKKPDTNN